MGLASWTEATPVAAVTYYTATPLGGPGTGIYSLGYGINANGDVTGGATTGRYDLQQFPFVYSGGTMTNLGQLPGAYSSRGSAINDSGQVTGFSGDPYGGYVHAFFYSGGTMIDLGTLGGDGSSGAAIDNNGRVTGTSFITGNLGEHAFLYSGGAMIDLGVANPYVSLGYGMNDGGQITGESAAASNIHETHAFLYSGGTATDLGTLGGTYSGGKAINNSGQVTGFSYTANTSVRHAFLYSGGTMSDIGTLGGAESIGYGINDQGQIVGGAATTGNAAWHAFLYSGGMMLDLNTLVIGDLGGAYLQEARGINENGQIVANGSDGVSYRLEPVADPGVTLTPIGGSGQSTRVGTAFSQPMVVLVKDRSGNPVPGAMVMWTGPALAASATFSGSPSGVTDSSGVATIAAGANAISGAYMMTAQFRGVTAHFNLTNTATVSVGNTCGANGATNSDLVEQYYAAILRRPSDAGGKAYWLGEADRLCALGVDPKETFFLLADTFYNSPEYLAFNRDNSGFVTDLYITFFGRLPDYGGLSYWMYELTIGMTRNNVMASFLFSPEFKATMNGLFPGRTARAETYLTMNLYGGLLRRLADSAGYTYWDGQFRLAECGTNPASAVTATIDAVSSQFLSSAEYVARATSNSQFVDDLYYAMLQRGGDLEGFNFWVGQLIAGVTRDQLRQQFLTSPEMQAQSAAIAAQGCLH